MIMGLRLLPWVLYYRRENKGAKIFDCETCMKTTTRAYRQSLNCGYLPPHERTGPGAFMQVPFRFPDDDADQCPGWLIRLPQVYEAQVAYLWSEKGQLTERYPEDKDLTLVMDCVQVLSAEQNEVDTHHFEKLSGKR